MQQCLEWKRLGYDLIAAVNLSPRNLHDPELPERVRALLDLLGAPASMLELEITESVIMSDPLRSLQVLTRLSKMGLRLAVDDFGTGYSSFSYLRKLPVHEIKIDKSFIDDMVEDGDEVIVQSTIELAHNLGLTCVAEGVQDEATLERLAKLGCDTAQGDFISPPLDGAGCRRVAAAARTRPGDAALILALALRHSPRPQLSALRPSAFSRGWRWRRSSFRCSKSHRQLGRRSDARRARSCSALSPALGYFGGTVYWTGTVVTAIRRAAAGPSAWWSRRCSSRTSSLFPALFTLCLGWLGAKFGRRAILLAPAVWVTTELGRTYFWSGFPWLLLGYSQTTVLPVAQFASVVGVFGMSALVALVSAALAYFVISRSRGSMHRRWRRGAVLVGVVVWGNRRLEQRRLVGQGTPVRVALVQGNIPQDQKWDAAHAGAILNTYLTTDARGRREGGAARHLARVVHAVSVPGRRGRRRADSRASCARRASSCCSAAIRWITGRRRTTTRRFSSARTASVAGVYQKMHLVPFGEFVPLQQLLFFVGPARRAGGGVYAGRGHGDAADQPRADQHGHLLRDCVSAAGAASRCCEAASC